MEKIFQNTGRLFLIVAVNIATIWFANWIIIKGFNWFVSLHWLFVLLFSTLILGCFEIVIYCNHVFLKLTIRNAKPGQFLLPIILLLLIFAVYITTHLWQHEPELIYWYEKYAYYVSLLASFLCWFAPISIYSIQNKKLDAKTEGNRNPSKIIDQEAEEPYGTNSEMPSKMLLKGRELFNDPRLNSDELIELVENGTFSYEHKTDPLNNLTL